jgi:phosphoribosylformimino-5-aminoimidazole carboxamide ribotide isomerase
MVIFPAIDLRGGRCVRLVQGDFARETVYDDDPVAMALRFRAQGAEFLHVVDLDGAREGAPRNLEVVRRLAKETGLRLQVGGGVRSLEIARELLDAGVERVVAGSRLASDDEFAKTLFAELGERVVAGIDARGGVVAVQGWTQTSGVPATDLARRLQLLGARRLIVTDIATDGMLTGPNIAFLEEMLEAVAMPVIASGGVGSLEDLSTLARLQPKGLEGAIVGKALYEGRFLLSEAITSVSPT